MERRQCRYYRTPLSPTQDKAREHLEAIRWPDGPICPHCGVIENATASGQDAPPGPVSSATPAASKFTVTVGTVFERSKIAAQQVAAGHPPAVRLQEGHQRPSAPPYARRHLQDRMVHVPPHPRGHEGRSAPARSAAPARSLRPTKPSSAARQRNRAFRKVAPKKSGCRAGRARRHRPASFHVANVTRRTTSAPADRHQRRSRLHLMTDDASLLLSQSAASSRARRVNHSARVCPRGDSHSNTVENFFSIFKRGVIGTYHHMSEAHLHRYCAEFDFRYNTRTITDRERADIILKRHRRQAPDLSADWSARRLTIFQPPPGSASAASAGRPNGTESRFPSSAHGASARAEPTVREAVATGRLTNRPEVLRFCRLIGSQRIAARPCSLESSPFQT